MSFRTIMSWLRSLFTKKEAEISVGENVEQAAVDAGWDIPPGTAEINVDFTLSEDFDWEAFRIIMSDASRFQAEVFKNHRLPALDDPIWDKVNLDWISMERRFGGWKVDSVFFKDGSHYEIGGKEAGVHVDIGD